MKTFLKVLLYVAVAMVAIKLLPLTLALGIILALVIGFGVFVGFSMLAVLLGVGLAVVAALAPIWLPALAVVGIVALIRKTGRRLPEGRARYP